MTQEITVRNHKNFAKKQRKQRSHKRKSAQAHSVRRAKIQNRYECTKCGSQVFKKRAASPAPTKDKPNAKTGLGHWRCRCGNKKVRRVPIVVEPKQEKAS